MNLRPVNMYIGAEDMDCNSPWCRKLDTEQILKEVIDFALEEDLMIEQSVDLYSDELEDIVGRLFYFRGTSDATASLIIEYNDIDEDTYKIPLDDIPLQDTYLLKLHDYDRIVAKAIEVFNENVDMSKFDF